jgi:RimJ/RimL family protein N-acetyltransferase
MKIILETERLLLREMTADDAENAYELNSDWEVIKYTGDEAFESVEAAKTFLENYKDYEKNGFGRWAVMLKETGEYLGWCGLKLNETIKEVDLGYRFSRRNWGKGYTTESSKACLEYGFNN